MPPNRSIAVELKLAVANYLSGMRQSRNETKLTAEQVLALSKAETQLEGAIAGATQSLKQNGATLDQTSAKGRANRQALDQIAKSTREYRQTLVAAGASQAEVAAATERGQAAWLSAASAMGMQETQAKKLSTTLFAASRMVKEHRAEIDSLAMTAGIAGAAVMLGVGKIVSSYASFDKQMSAVAAQGDDAKASLNDLRATAIKAGADTQYSATEAAQGITELLKAGVQAGDVLNGGLTGALNLAASGSMDVASAAEDMATALNQFGLDGSKASHVADLLAAGANSAQGEVSDMAMALSQGGLVAHQTGLSIEETVGALTMFAKAGLVGSDAGTSLKTMLQRLTPQSVQAANTFEDLGINAYDAQGKFVGLVNLSGQLHQQMKNLTPEARNAALQVMFGADAVRAASVLYEAGAKGAQQMTDAINQQGFAQRQAAELTNNLAGDIERLGGSIDTAFIRGGNGANQVLRGMAQGAESLVDWVGQLPEPLLSVATMLTGSGGIATLGVAGIAKLGSTVMGARDSFKMLGISAKTSKLAVAGVGGAIALGTIALMSWVQSQAEANAEAAKFASTMVVVGGKVSWTDSTLQSINESIVEARLGWFGLGSLLTDKAKEMGISVADLTGYLSGNADAVGRVTAAVQKYTAARYPGGIAGMDAVLGGDVAGNADVLGALDGMRSRLTDAEKAALAKAAADDAAGVGAKTYAEAQTKANAATEDGTSALQDYASKLFESANAALKASGTQIGWEAALDDTAKAIKKTGEAHRLANGQLDLNTAKGRANQQALNQLAQSSVAYAQSLMTQGASEKTVQSEMERSRSAFVKQATAAGMSKSAAKELADAYGLIPGDVKTNISVTGGDKSMTKLALVQAAISDLPAEQKVDVLTAFDNGGIKAADKALNKINGKHVKAYVDVEASYVDHYNKSRQGGPKLADGGLFSRLAGALVQRFADGGFGQPQVRAFQGSAGVTWGEQGSGPWEAFISGAPQKRDRSIAIWREVGQRLLGSGMSASGMLQAFADGGIAEPSYLGHPLSWWQDYLKTPLELTRAKIAVRDDKKDLAERETYYTGKGKHKKKHSRLKLRGLDRTEAQQQLAEDEKELDLALKAAELNRSKDGTIEARLAAYESAKAAADEAKSAADSTASSIAQSASSWASTFQTGSSLADLISNMQSGATQLAQFNDMVGQLKSDGLSSSMSSWLLSQGPSGISLAQQILAGGSDAIAMLNEASGNLNSASTAIATTQETGTYTKSPVLSTVHLPSYVTSGAAGPAAPGSIYAPRSATFNVTSHDPYGAAVIIDQQLRYL